MQSIFNKAEYQSQSSHASSSDSKYQPSANRRHKQYQMELCKCTSLHPYSISIISRFVVRNFKSDDQWLRKTAISNRLALIETSVFVSVSPRYRGLEFSGCFVGFCAKYWRGMNSSRYFVFLLALSLSLSGLTYYYNNNNSVFES